MIDQRLTHRCLLAEIASGEVLERGKPVLALQSLLLIGFVKRQSNPDHPCARLTLTEAGHRYLAGLWH